MAWPYILLWDLLIAPELAPQRVTFLLAYFAYFLATAFAALSGANAALALAQPAVVGQALSLSRLAESRWAKPFVDALTGAISAALAAFIASGAA